MSGSWYTERITLAIHCSGMWFNVAYHAISQQFCKMLFLAIKLKQLYLKKQRNLAWGCYLVGRKLFSHIICNKNHEIAFNKISKTLSTETRTKLAFCTNKACTNKACKLHSTKYPKHCQLKHEQSSTKWHIHQFHLQRLLVYFYPSDLVNTNGDFVTNSYGESWDSSCEK